MVVPQENLDLNRAKYKKIAEATKKMPKTLGSLNKKRLICAL